MPNLLKNLNSAQSQAVTFGKGPLLIIAGAGTGKTTVITTKIAWLIENKKAQPEEILALTFTEKAAEEMEERVDKLLPYGCFDLSISTFHSFCDNLLREWGLEIGLPIDFKLLNQTEQWLLIRENLDRFNLDYYKPLGNPAKFIQALVQHFSRLKDENIKPEEYLEYAQNLKEDNDAQMSENQICGEKKKILEVANAFHTYQNLLLEKNALDFGDLINYTLTLFKKRPLILQSLRKKIKYILIDEFQDTNWAQYELVKLLASPKDNITIVADDDQAIYRFRGASTSNVLTFVKDYPQARIITLKENYRSKQNILNLAYNFIQLNNPHRLEYYYQKKGASPLKIQISKRLKSKKGERGIIEHLPCKTAEEEVKKVVEKIEEIMHQEDSALSFSDFAILGRANNSLEAFVDGLARKGIPYLWLSSQGLYQKRIILDSLAYLKLLDNHFETAALFRVLNMPLFQIDYSDLCQINSRAQQKSFSLFRALQEVRRGTFTLNKQIQLKEQTIKSIEKLLSLLKKHTLLVRKNHKPSEIFIKFLSESGYLKYIEEQEEQEKRDNFSYLNQFYKKIKTFETNSLMEPTLKNLLLKIERELEAGDTGALETDFDMGPDAVRVMTIHGAKGLEFKYVFLVNLIDKRFPTIERKEAIEIPSQLIKEILPSGDIHLQEERRLFYVASTRAKEGLFFTSAQDYGGKKTRRVSRFLVEAGLVKAQQIRNSASLQSTSLTFNLAPSIPAKSITKQTQHSLDNKLSFTRFKNFNTCPLQYKYQFILKIPKKGNRTHSFGSSLHQTLFKLFQKLKRQENQEQPSLFTNESIKQIPLHKEISWAELKELYKSSWIDDWYESKKEQNEHFKRGLKILKEFYEKHQNNWPNVLFVEKGFQLRLGKWKITGRIDRIDKLPSGKVEIIDYKTGSGKDKEQLLLYQWAAEEALGLKVKTVSYYYLENNDKLSFIGQKEDIQNLKQKFLTTGRKLKESSFNPTPGYHCKYCDFKEICDYRKI